MYLGVIYYHKLCYLYILLVAFCLYIDLDMRFLNSMIHTIDIR